MRLHIKPNDTSLSLLLEANQYQQVWHEHNRKIRRAFREITGLDFQQKVITAWVWPDNKGSAGAPYQPMHLPGQNQSEDVKLITLVHELSHRLLGGNALGPVNLGLIPEKGVWDQAYQEYEHRHTYLFEYDIIEKALGSEYAALCRKEEESDNIDGPHDRAWEWAMSFTYAQRQRMLKVLTANKVERAQWDEFYDKKTVRIDPKEWEAKLITAAGGSARVRHQT